MSVATSLSMVVRSKVLVVGDLMWYQIAALVGVAAVPVAGVEDVWSWTPLMNGTRGRRIGVISVAVAGVDVGGVGEDAGRGDEDFLVEAVGRDVVRRSGVTAPSLRP